MGKKDFRGGLDSLLTSSKTKPAKKAEKPTQPQREAVRPSAMKAATFKFKPEHLEKLKAVAYFDNRLIQDLVAEALGDFFTKYEKTKGKIKTR